MTPQRSATVTAAFYPAVIIAGWAFASLAGLGSSRLENSPAVHMVDRLAPALTAKVEFTAAPQATAAATPPAIAMSYAASADVDVTSAAEFMAQPVRETAAASGEPHPIVVASRTDAAEVLSQEIPAAQPPIASNETQPVIVASLGDAAEVLPAEIPPTATTAGALPQNAPPAVDRIEIVGECLAAEPCIDQFLWALYQRTPKEDTIKEREFRKVTVKRKGRMVTVKRSFTRLVDNDFTWKDPKAAQRVGMSMMDYVIGGMDRSFKLKLFRALYAAEAAGLQPGITSAFRDDYRQSIASGLKAASDRSYHGGSSRGGYGRGLAADIVSVNGGNRAQRWAATEALWKWVDANGKQFGIGRPYLGRDPPHVGPIDGQEYASRRGGAKAATADVRGRHRHAAHGRPSAAKRPVIARSSKGRTV